MNSPGGLSLVTGRLLTSTENITEGTGTRETHHRTGCTVRLHVLVAREAKLFVFRLEYLLDFQSIE